MDQFDIKKQTETLIGSTTSSIKKLFPIKAKDRILKLSNIWAEDDLDPGDFQSQFKAKAADRTWGIPIYGAFELTDPSGEVVQKLAKVRLATLPKPTPRLSYIVHGAEHQIANQLRLRPAGYTVRTGPGGIKGQINLAKGYSGGIEMHVKPDTGVFSLKVGQANQKLYPILQALGITDSELSRKWGDQVLEANKAIKESASDNSIRSLAKSLLHKAYTDTESASEDLRKFVKDTLMDPEVNERTIGGPHKNMDGSFLTDLSANLLKVVKGEKEPHDRNALEYKEYRQITDLIEERLNLAEYKNKVIRKIQNKLNAREKLEDIINPTIINPHIEAVFNLPELHQMPKQLNPLDMINQASLVTIMGPGGVREMHQITDDMRNVHPSHMGFLDPIHTPETSKVGVVFHLPVGVSAQNKTLLTRAINVKTGKLERIDPSKFADSVVAFPGQYDAKANKWDDPKEVMVLGAGNKTLVVPAKEVEYILQSPKQVFSLSSNLTPFLPTNSGGRTLVGSKLSEQAVSLKDREMPLVQSKVGGNRTFEELLGDAFSFKSPVDGTVDSVSGGKIVIKDKKGVKHTVQIYNDFPLNYKSFIQSNTKIKKGDTVKEGQLLADTNFTDGGVLALGKNLITAYIPYKGYNFEDGIVITEDASKKLTSEHMYTEATQEADRYEHSRTKFVSNFPNVYTKNQLQNVDTDGIVKSGTVLQPGDPIITRLRKDEVDPENIIFSRLSRTLMKPWKDDSVKWDGDCPGRVVNVVRNGNKTKIYIKTEEPAQIGDKLVGRFGNKGIITKIIPTEEAPKTSDGTPVDIMLNPHGIVARINIGQLLENAISKVAKKQGKPYVVDNFSGENYTKNIKAELDKNGVTDLEELTDPVTNKSLGKVNVGSTYVLKLEKQVRSQFSARGAGPGWKYSQATQEPVKGGEEGSKAIDLLTFYSMLSHGARNNLREMASYKASRNDEFWNSLKTGAILPPPKPTFAYEKFMAYLKGAGVDVKQNGSKITLAPLTDREVTNVSKGEIKDFQFVRAKDLAEIKGGLMDKQLTGGIRGTSWSHIRLAEPVVNPVFEQPVKSVLDMDNKVFDGLVEGRLFVDETGAINDQGQGVTAGNAFKLLLSQVDKKKRLKEFNEMAKFAKSPTQLNKANKGIRYLEALNKYSLEPADAYILTKVPVLPPVFRPIYALPDGNLHTSTVNFLYRDLGVVSQKLDFLNSLDYMPEDAKQSVRRDLYNGVGAVAGIHAPIKYYPPNKPMRGLIEEIKGDPGEGAKTGFFQKHVLRREQDLVGRGTIIPEPKLGIDEVGLPIEMAWTIFQPFVMKELINQGYNAIDADKEILNRSFIAKKALDAAMEDRPVMLNRAPSLHKFSIMAFKPKLVEGRAIKIPPLIVKGFGADFNGDSVSIRNHCILSYNDIELCMPFGEMAKMILNKTVNEMILDAGGYTAIYELVPNALKTLSIVDGDIKWVPIKQITVHTSHKDCYNILTHTGTQLTITEHHNFSFINENLDLVASKTDNLTNGMLLPKAINFSNNSTKADQQISIIENSISLNEDLSWLLGFFAGDGSVDKYTVSFCDTTEEIFERVGNLIERIFGVRNNPQSTAKHKNCIWRIYNKQIAKWFTDNCGCGFLGKVVPNIIFNSNRKNKLAYIDGLFCAEGNVSIDSNGNYIVRIEMNNEQYLQQFRCLCSSIGIGTYLRKSYHKLSKSESFVLRFRKLDYSKLPNMLGKKQELIKLAKEHVSNVKKDFYDIVPFPEKLIEEMVLIGNSQRNLTREKKEIREEWRASNPGRVVNIGNFIKTKNDDSFISRHIAFDLIHTYGHMASDLFKKWINIVYNTDMQWEKIENIELTNREPVMFDVSVPDGEMFCVENGLLTHNTMHVHVPIMPNAVKEAKGMMPSKHLFNPGTGDIMMMPGQEAAIGLYFLTKEGLAVPKNFLDSKKLKKALEDKEVKIDDIVVVNGKRTTAGRVMVDALLPDKYQGRNEILDKKGIKKLLTEIGKNDPHEYADVVNKLTELGNEYAYQRGFTISIDDIQPNMPEKDAILANAKEKSKGMTDLQKIKLYEEVDKKIKTVISDVLSKGENSLFQMVQSGARGNMDQLKQIVSAPLLVEDVAGAILPMPIENSFSKGLSLGEYWNSLYGSRRGVVDKQLQTSKPGEFNKDLMATLVKNVISDVDCHTLDGLDFDIDDEDAQDRYLSEDIMSGSTFIARKGDLVDANLINKFRSKRIKKVKCRSPITCKMPKGTCAHCYGLDVDGRLPSIGDNIGAMAGQSLTEPLTQMVLRSMHSGGVVGAQNLTGYDKIDKLIHMPKTIFGSATLSEKDGKVGAIEDAPAGGKNVFVGDIKHFISPSNPLKVKVGSSVKRGDPLSDGIIQPRELVELRGMLPAQQYLTDEITNAYRGTNVNIKKKNVEVVVRSMTDTTKILDGGDSPYIYGDIIPYTMAESFNQSAGGKVPLEEAIGRTLYRDHGTVKAGTKVTQRISKVLSSLGFSEVSVGPDPILHEPFVDGIKQLPMLNRDWMAQMGYSHLARGIKEGAGESWSTDIHDYSPVPSFAYGAEFGQGSKGKY